MKTVFKWNGIIGAIIFASYGERTSPPSRFGPSVANLVVAALSFCHLAKFAKCLQMKCYEIAIHKNKNKNQQPQQL